MDTPLEKSNLAHIGSDLDHDLKKAAAETEVNWDGVGQEVGLKIWRVENKHEDGIPSFGINPWPEQYYGKFYTGDSYIILSTTQEDGDGALLFDIFFWIGSESTQDEYGVVAYKTCELDEYLNDVPIQHREVQYHESNQFLDLFDKNIEYLDGGISGGFREIADIDEDKTLPARLFHIRRGTDKKMCCVQVPARCSSLNQGDTFVLDAGEVIYTWFGTLASGFEKNKAGTLSHNLADHVGRKATRQESDVGDDNEEFWNNLLGEKEDIMEADDSRITDVTPVQDPAMFILSDVSNELKIESVPADRSSLDSNNVCLIDIGATVFVWKGNGSTEREKKEAMRMAQTYFRNLNRGGVTTVITILEGQEERASGWPL